MRDRVRLIRPDGDGNKPSAADDSVTQKLIADNLRQISMSRSFDEILDDIASRGGSVRFVIKDRLPGGPNK